MRAYKQAGIGPSDVDVAEVHDSIAFNEMLAYEELAQLAQVGGGFDDFARCEASRIK